LGGPAAEDVPDPGVLVVLETQLPVGLVEVRCGLGALDAVHLRHDVGHAATSASRTDRNMPRPSSVGPVNGSIACSGCGIRPATRPRASVMPAMSRWEPLGFSSA